MGTAFALAVYAVLLGVAATAVWRRPLFAVYAFIVGLALHNAVMAGLFALGVRGTALTAIQAWKEILLAVALARVARDAWRERRLPLRLGLVDALAGAFAALVLVYALIPQELLGGVAGAKTVLYALRHDLGLVASYFLGRSLALRGEELRRVAWTIVGAAATVAVIGLIEVYSVPIEWWRDADVPGYFEEQLGFEHIGPAGLPENFVFNTGDENDLLRRLVSVFLSPLGTAYMLVAGLLLAAALRARPRLLAPLAVLLAVGLYFTFTRSALIALAGGLVVLGLALRRWWPVGLAGATLVAGVAFALAYPTIAPETHWFPEDLAEQRERARQLGGIPSNETVSLDEPSIRSHLTNLRAGLENVARHPQGYGLGNAGTTALRTDVPLQAGESTYAEVGAETGLLGMLLFVAWVLALLWTLVRVARGGGGDAWAAAGVAATLAAVLAIAVQTDVLGVPWLTFCVWLLAGSLVAPAAARQRARAPHREASELHARLERA